MNIIEKLHANKIFPRRVAALAGQLRPLLPPSSTVLDVGCGDGTIDVLIREHRPDVVIEGLDVLLRKDARINVAPFDGRTIPYADGTFDLVMFIDVLHHAQDPSVLLEEAKRVARHAVIVKDHTKDGLLAGPTLRLMDWVGNARHGIALPYNYWTERQWHEILGSLGLRIDHWTADIGLYPWPASALFDRKLHFIAKLIHA